MTKSGEFKEPRKIISNLSVFLAPILSWLVRIIVFFKYAPYTPNTKLF